MDRAAMKERHDRTKTDTVYHMTAPFQKFVVSALVLIATMSSFAQVYSSGVYAGGVTYYSSRWTVGSPPFRFGLEEYSYSTDGAGYIIMISQGRRAQPGDTFHRKTRLLLGPISFSVPLRPAAVVIIGGGIVLAIGFLLPVLRSTAYTQKRDRKKGI